MYFDSGWFLYWHWPFQLNFTDPINLGRNCDEVVCTYGAECEQDGDRAGCICNIACSDITENEVKCLFIPSAYFRFFLNFVFHAAPT